MLVWGYLKNLSKTFESLRYKKNNLKDFFETSVQIQMAEKFYWGMESIKKWKFICSLQCQMYSFWNFKKSDDFTKFMSINKWIYKQLSNAKLNYKRQTCLYRLTKINPKVIERISDFNKKPEKSKISISKLS